MKELVILDLDGTIVNGQSQQLFLNYLFRKRIVGLFFYLKINFWFILYKLGLLKSPGKIDNIMRYSFSFLNGKSVKEVENLAIDFFDKVLKRFISSEMTGIINKHRAEGRESLIISNAADVIVGEVARFLGISDFIATKLEIKDGCYTGKILGDIVYGKNKLFALRNFVGAKQIKIASAYSDHVSDLDLLLMAQNPCAVNPDGLLLQEAKKRNWTILKFNL